MSLFIAQNLIEHIQHNGVGSFAHSKQMFKLIKKNYVSNFCLLYKHCCVINLAEYISQQFRL